jgi:hypothetical protein
MTERSVEMLCSMLMLSMLLVLILASSHGGNRSLHISTLFSNTKTVDLDL